MRDFLDAGDKVKSRAMMRELMDSSVQKVRLLVIDAMEWSGAAMIPDLVELIGHKDEVTAEAALQAWERVVDGVDNDGLKCDLVFKAASAITNVTFLHAVFMHLLSVDVMVAMPKLDAFIVATKGKVCNIAAKEIFLHIASEEWSSSERTGNLLKELKNKGTK